MRAKSCLGVFCRVWGKVGVRELHLIFFYLPFALFSGFASDTSLNILEMFQALSLLLGAVSAMESILTKACVMSMHTMACLESM